MKTSVLCPISDKQIDENVARMNAAFTFALIVIFGLSQSIIPVIFLAVDFLLRSTGLSIYSPLGLMSRRIVLALDINKSQINAGPKIFAARLGLFMTTLIALLMVFNATWTAFLLAGILALFSFLEAAFSICVACEIYPYLYKYLNRPERKS